MLFASSILMTRIFDCKWRVTQPSDVSLYVESTSQFKVKLECPILPLIPGLCTLCLDFDKGVSSQRNFVEAWNVFVRSAGF
jgi:hypothetical protein